MIAVMGAGAFGTALAVSIARGGVPVTLWARDPAAAAQMQTKGENPRLPGVALPDGLNVTAETGSILTEVPILLAAPMQQLRAMATTHRAVLTGHPLIACCKGIELATGLGPAQVLAEVLPEAVIALLTGPSFAADIARGLPTALTLACADPEAANRLQRLLTTPNLRVYRSDDVTGAETGGAMKNVIAIACGAAMGAGYGESARAAVMTRGYAEMLRLALARGARAETLAGLSGLGDLALTCTSAQSRNYGFGQALGRGDGFDAAITVEGAATARAVAEASARLGVEMPITRVVVALIDAEIDMEQALGMLLSRPLKEE
ncbi:NAD(P)H-dependent glycerol-3-phosphate dehydrogenase [Pseudooceanicola sp.]|uniref:NAD(P)H-dependent glycerol-3-phosphate dehydrogenase n=1 Tax=Pseudooceanicola sp. TaxID=1914328 RepID=UPI002627539D|nr:NAD(P)H-dependent glycerol-3-phosphate dehydrogenase [Pseudooceanicola sp.]MDF1857020.1 NAD(P)-dependent glycerol-3-phosphate dehydrogenase [Pseudooceanicola sp.]